MFLKTRQRLKELEKTVSRLDYLVSDLLFREAQADFNKYSIEEKKAVGSIKGWGFPLNKFVYRFGDNTLGVDFADSDEPTCIERTVPWEEVRMALEEYRRGVALCESQKRKGSKK